MTVRVRWDLKEFLTNSDKPNCPDGYKWVAGEQPNALRFYLKPSVEILAEYADDAYQGECFALLRIRDRLVIWRDYFGSCSGCDALEGGNGYEYISDTMQEGNTKQFHRVEEIIEYLNTTDDWNWKSRKETVLRMIESWKKGASS